MYLSERELLLIICAISMILAIYLCIIQPFKEAKQEQERLKSRPVKRMKLKCTRKAIYDDDFKTDKGRIYFKIDDDSYECKVPDYLYDKIEKGKKFCADFYVDHHPYFVGEEDRSWNEYDMKSINGVKVPSKWCRKLFDEE